LPHPICTAYQQSTIAQYSGSEFAARPTSLTITGARVVQICLQAEVARSCGTWALLSVVVGEKKGFTPCCQPCACHQLDTVMSELSLEYPCLQRCQEEDGTVFYRPSACDTKLPLSRMVRLNSVDVWVVARSLEPIIEQQSALNMLL
jgi:hypothetical protein